MADRSTIHIRPTTVNDKPFMRAEMRKWWGDEMVVVRGKKYHPAEHDGFIAEQNGEIRGLILLHFADDLCEIISLSTSTEAPPIGKDLVSAAMDQARDKGAQKIIVVTTNDNVGALRFYQQMGFSISAWRKNAINISRTIKPQIPLRGNYNIPIRDEIELEIQL